jgi:hypothetical protein
VVLRVVDRVDTDGVNAERLKVLNVAPETLQVEQRVGGIGGTT